MKKEAERLVKPGGYPCSADIVCGNWGFSENSKPKSSKGYRNGS